MNENINFPYEFIPFTTEENKEMQEYFEGIRLDFSRIAPKGYVVSKQYETEAANIYNFPLRPDDVFVVTFPKSGTTWTQELVWLINNNLDYEKAKSTLLGQRFPFLDFGILPDETVADQITTSNYKFLLLTLEEFCHLEPILAAASGHAYHKHALSSRLNQFLVFIPTQEFSKIEKDVLSDEFLPLSVDNIKELPSPRFIKSHLPLSLLPPTLLDDTKVVYVARDPRDVAVSFYHHNKLVRISGPENDFKSFWNYFLKDKLTWCPYFASVLEAWEKRNHSNMLFLFYEELSEDLPGVIRRVAKFFDKQLTDDQVEELREHLKFDNFKKNKSVNMENMQEMGLFTTEGGFLRKGKVGTWREYFDEDMTAQAEKWITENLQGSDFKFPKF